MAVSIEDIKKLRAMTGAGLADVKEGLLVEAEGLLEAVHHQRGPVFLKRHADRCVDAARLGFRALPEDPAVGKVHPFARRGEEFRSRPERFVELNREFVHDGSVL